MDMSTWKINENPSTTFQGKLKYKQDAENEYRDLQSSCGDFID